MADAMEESRLQAEAEAAAEAGWAEKAAAEAEADAADAAEMVATFAMIAACERGYAASFLAAHGGDLERAIHAFIEPSSGVDAQEGLLVLPGGEETDGLSEASSRLLRSCASACGSELSSEAVAVDLADVASEWSELANSDELGSLPSDWE